MDTFSHFSNSEHSCGPRFRARVPSRAAQSAGVREAQSAEPGLVSSPTSGTSGSRRDFVCIDKTENRLKRMRRRVLTGARLHVSQVNKWRPAMLTLTYRPGVEWDKRHISECVRCARQWLKRRGVACRYIWSMELTRAGKPHYHIVVWLPWGTKLPKLDEAGWWPHGMTRMEWARCAVGYISKYVTKGQEDVALPKGARMYGVGGLHGDALNEARWWALPGWLRDEHQISKDQQIRRRVGGGWIDRDTGEVFSSPWRVKFFKGQVFAYRHDSLPIEEVWRLISTHRAISDGSRGGDAALVA
jgi:hypothetical protein